MRYGTLKVFDHDVSEQQAKAVKLVVIDRVVPGQKRFASLSSCEVFQCLDSLRCYGDAARPVAVQRRI
jgi:hypothetical protein